MRCLQKRLPVKNCVVNTGYRNKAYAFIENEVKKRASGIRDLSLWWRKSRYGDGRMPWTTSKTPADFPEEIQFGLLHGQMKPAQKNKVMEAFMKNEVQVLVATTVGSRRQCAECHGHDDRKCGASSALAQLSPASRGRVGRGDAQSYCIMVNCSSAKTAERRLKILNDSNDGFRIARRT